MSKVYLLYIEISDQYGTDKCIGVYNTKETAQKEADKITRRRSFIEEKEMNTEISLGEI